ncbi:DUF4332 domain-containing protein [Candidatus Laterigemmans baculatus]|uniref:DUF4332 domain-containing protein n=1 Tax=Candidatus Laterigemmans baculatus TaxID=2770505 RepID=UPI0013DACEBB|nr:DUF4332 domain-containing protein [Candidatus Laterigemmans baculatus]
MILSFLRGLLGGRPLANSRPNPPTARPAPPASPNHPPQSLAVEPPKSASAAPKLSEPVVLSFRMTLDRPAPDAPNRLPQVEPIRRSRNESLAASSAAPLTLRQAGLGSPAQRRALRSIGIRTTDELLAADSVELAERLGLSPRAAATLRRWQRAIRLARLLPAMMPREALLLRAVHRKTLRSLANESPLRLRRDLQRYALSTAGARLLGDQPLPAVEQIRAWIETARRRTAARTSRSR